MTTNQAEKIGPNETGMKRGTYTEKGANQIHTQNTNQYFHPEIEI